MKVYVKETIWRKYVLEDDVDLEIIKVVLSNGSGDDLYNTNKVLYNELEVETCEELTPEQNDGQWTIEVQTDDRKIIWTNTND